jgi:hypothetical protein
LDELKVSIIDDSTQDTEVHSPRNNIEVTVTKISQHEYSFNMPDADVSITATFKEILPTGVVDLNADTNRSNKRYNLMGQPVSKDYHGIVIEDGRIIIVK